MTDFTVRSDSVDVEQIMRQIRSRIREKRGVDYTEEEIRELANVKLEKFLDPRGVRSDLLDQFRRSKAAMPAPENYAFEEETIYETHRGFIRWMRKLLNPLLKLLFNPNPLGRYSLGTKTKTLKYSEDGSLTLYASAKSPGKDKESNWLPAPNGTFSLYIRAYWPDKAIVDATWQPPRVEVLK